jgi:UDP-N-acetyl-2-amino-2-deoxyglucuronate dehydrogenase
MLSSGYFSVLMLLRSLRVFVVALCFGLHLDENKLKRLESIVERKLKMALIGCGRISYKHIEAIVNNNNELNLAGVCDLEKEKAENKAEEYVKKLRGDRPKPFIYDDYVKMLQEVDLDLVSIATESGYHSEIAIQCLKRGKHVIVEKPLALSTGAADRMIEAAKANQVKIAVCHQNRFNKWKNH